MSQKAASKQKRRVVLGQFFRNVWLELKKVSWPSRKEIIIYTTVVLASVLIVALIIWLFDSIFSFLMSFIL
ncbi:MAG TPA: preprotein translocase subunit SecE [Peptococcaceae bacterium]|nr:MAG: Preprotein translocase, SecE subunit [Clostridia bacterium 41_269]HBT20974.1 preprotein translocase subunit SecE [Peptococcaceae bacterium]